MTTKLTATVPTSGAATARIEPSAPRTQASRPGSPPPLVRRSRTPPSSSIVKPTVTRAATERLRLFGAHLPFPALGHARAVGDRYEYVIEPWVTL